MSYSEVLLRKRPCGRAVEDVPVDVEARAVTGAIPRFLGAIELHQAAEMRAHARHRMEPSRLVTIDAEALAADAHGLGFAGCDLVGSLRFDGMYAIAHEVHREIDVLA